MSLFMLLSATAETMAAQGPGVAPGSANWLQQLPAQVIVVMMAGFVIWGLIKKGVGDGR
jgi:hypothetical protein